MTIMLVLAPLSLLLAVMALVGFFWTIRAGQYDDPQGDAARILIDDGDRPAPPPV